MGAITKWNKYAPKLKLSKKILLTWTQPNFFTFNGTSRLQGPSGRQTAMSFLQCDQSPLSVILGQVPGTNATRRLFLQDCYFEYAFANATNVVANVDIYDLTFKREMDAADGTDLLPEGAWQAGEIQQGNSLGLTILGSYPTRNDNFRTYYKIDKKQSHMLAPGDVHRHKIHIAINKFMTGNRIADSARYANLTTASMLVASGNPIDNIGDTSGYYDASSNFITQQLDASGNPLTTNVTTGSVSTAPVALNIVWRTRYTYRWVQDNESNTVINNNNVLTGSFEAMQNTGVAAAFDAT